MTDVTDDGAERPSVAVPTMILDAVDRFIGDPSAAEVGLEVGVAALPGEIIAKVQAVDTGLSVWSPRSATVAPELPFPPGQVDQIICDLLDTVEAALNDSGPSR